ncbi:MAG TPA: hypothetical protein VEP90_00360 [Methylomirabilota bacterium]|nr:hypothetical protein [Methylomirabilota bacterium]
MSDTYNFSGNFTGTILNVNSILENVTQAIGTIPNIDQSGKDRLNLLVKQLQDTLQNVPPDQVDNANKVAKRAKELIEEANDTKPDKEEVERKGENLKKAALNLTTVLPSVVNVVGQIVSLIMTFIK